MSGLRREVPGGASRVGRPGVSGLPVTCGQLVEKLGIHGVDAGDEPEAFLRGSGSGSLDPFEFRALGRQRGRPRACARNHLN